MPLPRVAVAFEYTSVHGGERSLLAAGEALRDRFDLTALAPAAGPLADALTAAGWPVVGCDVKEPASLMRALATVRPDLLHGNSLSVGRALGRIKSELPCAVTAHLRDILNLSRTAVRDLGRCDRLIAVSAATRAHHVGRGLPADRTVVVHNGIDREAFLKGVNRAAARASVRNELGAPADAQLLLTVGQVGLRKGWDVLAAAFEHLPRSPSEPFSSPPHLLAVGERWSRKAESVRFEEDVLAALNRHAPGRALRLGTRSDVPRLMAASDLLVHPARQEPFGRVLLEAAAAGLPIVAAPVGGTAEMLRNAFAPFPPGDSRTLAAQIARVLANESERTRLATAASRRVRRFTVAQAAAGLATAWDQVLDSLNS
ncbi:MAG: glycosyltransferase family 4 protein [Planctomycetota bacterium]